MKRNRLSPVLKSFTVGVLLLLVFMPGCSQPDPGLKDVFKDCFQIGAAINPAQVLGRDPLAHEFILKHFNSMTSDNEMKFERIHPKPECL